MKLKSIFFILHVLLISAISVAQTTSIQYDNLVKKADRFYRTKNYKSAAVTYTLAFKSNGWKAPVTDRYNAACAWALANMPDSAFYQLHRIVDYIDYQQITTDHDLNTLHTDKRWKPLLENIQQTAKRKEAKLNKRLIKQLDSIYTEDQQYRKQRKEIEKQFGRNSQQMNALFKIMDETDSINLIKVKKIIDHHGWLGADVIGEKGNSTLFLVIQHTDLKTQEKYLPLLREAVKNGKAYPQDLALLEDRVALKQGKKQIYGSQIIGDSITGKEIVAPIEDEENVNKRRATVGLEAIEDWAQKWGIEYKSKSKKELPALNVNTVNTKEAIEIRDSIMGPYNVSRRTGTLPIFIQNGYEVKDDNSIWFKFTINHDTLLSFDIVPENGIDDYDFALFKCTSNNFMNGIRTKKEKPIRYCFSMNGTHNGATGLSEYASTPFVGSGPGLAFASALPVKAGETYFLMITCMESYWIKHTPPKAGFTIYFYNYWPKKYKRVTTKSSIVLENVWFETNKAVLIKASFTSLDKLVSQLQTNKTMKIEIRGHTDNVGDEVKNQQLSENRAKAVREYIISKNIDEKRVFYKGFGSKQPIASNDTEEGRKKNRRVELVIVK